MPPFDADLQQRLAALREQGLYRELRKVDSAQGPRIEINGRKYLNFSSNDYLGLANHASLKEASIKCIEKYGAGAGASRLICGSQAPLHELEEALASFKKVDAALTFSTGYAAAVGTITALAGKDDIIILDKLVHASIVDAARLSGAKLRVFAHNDLNDLEEKLKWAKENAPQSGRTLVITESIFSMDGDAAPLREIVTLKEKYGAWLMIDEAHATGVLGNQGRGLADKLGVSPQIEIQMGTLGKAVGASGGFICGSRSLINYLVNRARSFIFSTAPVPAAAAAANAGIQIIQAAEGEERRVRLWKNLENFKAGTPDFRAEISSAILPLILGEETKAVSAAAKLKEQGIFVPAIRYPTVARNAARLRITLTAAHTPNDIATLTNALKSTLDPLS